jgi:hypothetical protein
VKGFNDAGRLSRTLMCLAMIPTIVLAASNDATMQVGHKKVPLSGCGMDSGYDGSSSFSFGSYSPTGLGGGRTVAFLDELSFCDSAGIEGSLSVSGFTSNPGKSWLTSVTCNGVTQPAASATFTYFPSDGSTLWQWPAGFGLKNIPAGTNIGCTIVHQ